MTYDFVPQSCELEEIRPVLKSCEKCVEFSIIRDLYLCLNIFHIFSFKLMKREINFRRNDESLCDIRNENIYMQRNREKAICTTYIGETSVCVACFSR